MQYRGAVAYQNSVHIETPTMGQATADDQR